MRRASAVAQLGRLRTLVDAERASWLIVVVYAAVLAVRLRPNIFGDDAAITFRYVERLLSGHGLTYNDHERVLGTSTPLYAILLAVVSLAGTSAEKAATVVDFCSFVGSAVLATLLTKRLSGSRLAGVAAGLVLSTDAFYRYQCLSGMESGLSAFLGLSAIAALRSGREVGTGVVLGLAILNKLDAAFLALPVAVAWFALHRHLSIKMALACVAVVLPWFVFALFYYGSLVPHSLVAKLYLQEAPRTFDHFWIWSFLLRDHRAFLAAAAVASVGLARVVGVQTRERTTAFALGGWFLFHFLAFSVIGLGDYYPWYLTVLIPPCIILTYALAGRLWIVSASTRYRVFAAAGLATALWFGGTGSARATLDDLRAGNPIKRWEAFDDDRRLAGIFLRQYADPNEVVTSAYGWPAFASKMKFNDVSLLNTEHMVEPTMYRVEHGVPAETGMRGPRAPGGFIPLATLNLASDLYPGYSWFTVFGRPDSYAARIGARYLQYRLFELAAPTAYSNESGLEHIQIIGTDLFAHPPSGATFSMQTAHQPVHVVFTPAFAPTVPTDKTDGVTFELRLGDKVLYERHVLPTRLLEPVIVDVPDASRQERLDISFLTGTGPRGDPAYDWAIWKSVKIVVGSAFIDLLQLGDPKLESAWAAHNPTGISSRADQIARRVASWGTSD